MACTPPPRPQLRGRGGGGGGGSEILGKYLIGGGVGGGEVKLLGESNFVGFTEFKRKI